MTGRHSSYCPIDELIEDMAFMILRTIRRFDWADSSDIAIAMNIPSEDVDRRRRNSFDVTLSRLHRRGLIERIGTPSSFNYRITAAGQREYRRQLERNAA